MVATELGVIGAAFAWFDQRQALRRDWTSASFRRPCHWAAADARCRARPRVSERRLHPHHGRPAAARARSPSRRRAGADPVPDPPRPSVRVAERVARAGRQPQRGAGQQRRQAVPAPAPSRMRIAVPETLITNDPAATIAFRDRHRLVVYKSMSGERSIVSPLTDLDLERLDRLRLCPVQFQAWVPGPDVRVHVVGARRSRPVSALPPPTTATRRDRHRRPRSRGTVPADLAERVWR